MFRLVASMLSAFALFWLGIGLTEWWEHRAPGWPSYTASIGPLHHTFSFPDGLGAKLKASEAQRVQWDAALGQCHDNTKALKAAIDLQNASLAALGQESARRLAGNEKVVQAALAQAARAKQQSAVISAQPPAGADVCARYEDVDTKVLESLK
jgi:hypothetical protein